MAYNEIYFYLNDIGARVIEENWQAEDRYHLGKIIAYCLKADPEFVMQIDGATNQSETNESVYYRSSSCAVSLGSMGLREGDVMVLMGPNHIDLCIPHYAALYLGMPIASIDETLGVNELEDTFNIIKPKVIFCQREKTADIEQALRQAKIEAKIVTFNEGSGHTTLAKMVKNAFDEAVIHFTPTHFDATVTPAYLTCTSGTTGTPKAATLTHMNLVIGISYLWQTFTKFPSPTRMLLLMSPIQWLTAGMQLLFSPIVKVTRLQSSKPMTPDHFADLLNKYKPTFTVGSPVLLNSMLSVSDKCDFSCFEAVLMGGSAVSEELIEKVKAVTKSDRVFGVYGMSEIAGAAFRNIYTPPKGSSGSAGGMLEYRLVDPISKEDVSEANAPGELWLRGRQVFMGYYNKPAMTAETLTEDGWIKTGDIFYRDEHMHFYFVERYKSLLKYRNHQVSPAEVEAVIRKHPGVLDVSVTGIPDEECGDLVVACVIPKPGCAPTAQEIKDLVKESLTDSKQLRGGVIFLKEFPMTSSSKINRKKIKEIALTMNRE